MDLIRSRRDTTHAHPRALADPRTGMPARTRAPAHPRTNMRLRARASALVAAVLLAGCGGLALGPPAPGSPGVVATIPVGAPPTLLAVSPDGGRLYAASSGSLAVIDTARNAVVATLSTNPNATGIAVAPDGSRVYVNFLFSVSMAVLDARTNTLLDPIQLFLQRFRGGFTWMALAADGATAYVANATNRGIAIVALPSGTGEFLLPDVRPSDVALTPDGRTVYLAGCKAICTPGFVQLLDTATRRFTAEIEVGGNPYRVAVARDGLRAYTANLSGPSVSVIDTATQRVIATVDVAVQPTGLAVSPDSRTVWVASQTGGALTAIDAPSHAVRASLPLPASRDVAVSPDGQRVYVSGERAVTVLDAAAVAPG